MSQVFPTSYSTEAAAIGILSLMANPTKNEAIHSTKMLTTAHFHPCGVVRHKCQHT